MNQLKETPLATPHGHEQRTDCQHTMIDQPPHIERSPHQQSPSVDFSVNPIITRRTFSRPTVDLSQGRKELDQEMLEQGVKHQEELLRFYKGMEGKARVSKLVQEEHNINDGSSGSSGFGATQEEGETMELPAATSWAEGLASFVIIAVLLASVMSSVLFGIVCFASIVLDS
jgi:hypothetical protein